jgi:2'-5' RNA ligase
MLVVIGYPKLVEPDYRWIQRIRAQFDSQFQIIEPHFTLVFPCLPPNQTDFVEHVKTAIKRMNQIHFVIRQALTIQDRLSKQYLVFLAPQEGASELITLHDILYAGLPEAELRKDIPFIPHITIGNGPDPEKLTPIIEEFNTRSSSINGLTFP